MNPKVRPQKPDATDPMLPPPGSRVVFLHAHPDDETLSTGVLISWLVEHGYQVAVVTATRGEQGATTSALSAWMPDQLTPREQELALALSELGVKDHVFLGTPPARTVGLIRRRYTDSGMRWLDLDETLAGPTEAITPDSLSSAVMIEAGADLAAYLSHAKADLLISYDHLGGYGHPDHVACQKISRVAASIAEVPLREVVSDRARPRDDAQAYELSGQLPTVRRALAHYESQLQLEGDEIIHVGGQRQPITTTVHLAHPA